MAAVGRLSGYLPLTLDMQNIRGTSKESSGYYHVVPQWSLDYGYYNGVESTIDIANELHAIFHMVSESSSPSNHFHSFLLNHFVGK